MQGKRRGRALRSRDGAAFRSRVRRRRRQREALPECPVAVLQPAHEPRRARLLRGPATSSQTSFGPERELAFPTRFGSGAPSGVDQAQPRFRADAGGEGRDRSGFLAELAFGARSDSSAIASTTGAKAAERREKSAFPDWEARNLGSGARRVLVEPCHDLFGALLVVPPPQVEDERGDADDPLVVRLRVGADDRTVLGAGPADPKVLA